MKITIEMDTTVQPTAREKAILSALIGTDSTVTVYQTAPAGNTGKVDPGLVYPTGPTVTVVDKPQTVQTPVASLTVPAAEVAAKPSHTDTLVPTSVVTDPNVPTMDQMRSAITQFIAHPKCGGTAAMKGILKRYNATGLTGANPVPVERYTELHEELMRLIRLAPTE